MALLVLFFWFLPLERRNELRLISKSIEAIFDDYFPDRLKIKLDVELRNHNYYAESPKKQKAENPKIEEEKKLEIKIDYNNPEAKNIEDNDIKETNTIPNSKEREVEHFYLIEKLKSKIQKKSKYHKKDHIMLNMNSFDSLKGILMESHKKLGGLLEQNIPKLSIDSNFSRKELFQFFILFKTLCDITTVQNSFQDKESTNGISYEVWKASIARLSNIPDELVRKLYIQVYNHQTGHLDWRDFLNSMRLISSKTLSDKVDLFIKVADTNGNGELSYSETHHLCLITLQKYIEIQDKHFVGMLADYFTKFIFQVCDYDIKEEIPITKIKELIKQRHPESNLLCMFCGVDL